MAVEASTVAAHTPGPWTVEERFAERQVVVLARVDERVSMVVAAGGSSSDEMRANARLIGAAPDLLQALQEIAGDCYALDGDSPAPHCRFCDHSEGAKHDADCVMQFVEAAMAKAVRS